MMEKSDPDEGREADEPPPAAGSAAAAFLDLSAFSSLQRQVAAMQREAVRAAITVPVMPKLPALASAYEAAMKSLRDSIDLTRLQPMLDQLTGVGEAREAQRRLALDVARMVDVPAMQASRDAMAKALDAYSEPSRRIAEVFKSVVLPKIELPSFPSGFLAEVLAGARPDNLRDCDRLDEVARLAVEEGLPLAWVPRAELVEALLDAASAEERAELLVEHAGDVLDDCRETLDGLEGEWAKQCRSAIDALGAGFDGPAQSHASNIIDSIVLTLPGGRAEAKRTAEVDFADVTIRVVCQHLVLCPLALVFVHWFPSEKRPPPEHFARHATSHAVGHQGLFGPYQALVAVMVATSLTRQFADDDPSVAAP